MKNSKKFIGLVFGLCFGIVLFVGGVNYIIDPFQQYRKTTLYKVGFLGSKERYLNPGLAKNFNYKSIIIGSSMTENFLISKSSEILNNPIKLCISGGSAHEIFLTLKTAFETDKKIETVLVGFDLYAISGKIDRLRHGDSSIPLYLYDSSALNDYIYLLNLDTLVDSAKAIVRPIIKKDDILYNYENMYQWQHLTEKNFGREKVLAQLKKKKNHKNFKRDDWSFETLKKSFDANLYCPQEFRQKNR